MSAPRHTTAVLAEPATVFDLRTAALVVTDAAAKAGAAETTLGVSTEFQRVSGQLGGVYRLGAGYGADGVKADRLADMDRAPAG
ncbi:MAG: hypothetical protein P8Y82_08795, partial [Methyloceanibacter sp.]